ncbi:hypothetical protein JTB14_020615 [Gonioctena quinquepunctata]|nr:hypothetical protein JTB14_020615 [Gonioctena quinquepunctata]
MAEVLKKQRKSNFSPDEVDVLVRTVGKNYETLYGEFSKRAINKNARHRAWIDVTKEVNQVSLEKRTLQEVKNKWKKCQHLYRAEDFVGGSEELVNLDDGNVWEPLTSIEDEASFYWTLLNYDLFHREMKIRNKASLKTNNKDVLKRRQCAVYDPEFKKVVVLYAEQKTNKEARRKYGVSESNIRRWRRIKAAAAQNNIEKDSMPLEQRLKTPTDQEATLQSQPLSPTKLKVTRHTKPSQSTPKSPTPPTPIEEVCLKWNSHHTNMQTTFPSLLLREQYVDATLVAEGQTLKCHRVILSSCSPYFEEILASISPYQHPVLFMKDVPFWILKSLCDFMYAGEVHILQTKLEELLAVAETLKIKGLAGTTENAHEEIKTEPGKIIKEEKEESEVQGEEIKKKEVKEVKKKDDKEVKKKDDKEVKKKDDKEVKKKEEIKEVKDKKRPQPAPPPIMPILKSVKLSKITPHTDMPILKSSRSSKNINFSRRAVRKIDRVEKINKELKSEFLDPLDLLEPVYEELTKEPTQATTLVKPKEIKTIPVRRSMTKRLKKRKMTEEREESPPPILSRKGTRSRPNRKVPKFYHPSEEQSTIVREPHTDQADPLMHLQDIKAEPLDPEENTIEIEDNLVDYSEHDITIEDEEIMGSYDSPIVNFRTEEKRGDTPTSFTKIGLLPQPIIMNVESITEKSGNKLKILDLTDTRDSVGGKASDPLEDPLNFNQNSSDAPAVQNVLETNENSLGFHISQVITENEDILPNERCNELGFQITNVVSEMVDSNTQEKLLSELDDSVQGKTEHQVFNEVQEMAGNIKNEAIIEKSGKTASETMETESQMKENVLLEEKYVERQHQNESTSVGMEMSQKCYVTENNIKEMEGTSFQNDIGETQEDSEVITQLENSDNANQAEEADELFSKTNQFSWSNNKDEIEGTINPGKQVKNVQEGKISNSFEMLQLNEDLGNSKMSEGKTQLKSNEDSPLIDNIENVGIPNSQDGLESEQYHIEQPSNDGNHDDKLFQMKHQTFSGNDKNTSLRENVTSTECALTQKIDVNSEFPSSSVSGETPKNRRASSSPLGYPLSDIQADSNQDSPFTTELQCPAREKIQPCGFSPENYNQDSVLPQTMGFHIAQVVNEQIAQNEESKFTDHCDIHTNCEGDERCNSNSNELETIVKDLTKIVGDSCSESISRSNEGSSVIAESLENLLQD